MKQPQLSQFTPSTTSPFRPTRVFYIHTHPGPSILASLTQKSKNEDKSPKIDIFEITTETLSSAEIKEQILHTTGADFRPYEIVPLVAKLEHLAREVESPFLRIAKGGWCKRFFEATRTERTEGQEEDAEGTEKIVARLDGPLLDMGHWKLSFPGWSHAQTQTQPTDAGTAEGEEEKHEVQLRPTGPGSNTDVFVLNSVPFIWEMCHGREVFRLWRCGMPEAEAEGSHEGNDKVKGVRREVGVYIARNHRDPGKEGVLVLDDGGGNGEEGVDAIVGIMTCLGTCNQVHSFRK